MPGRDGTGPMGAGSMTGRGLGFCRCTYAVPYGAGSGLELGCRRGSRRGLQRGFVASQAAHESEIDMLLQQKTVLQQRLDVIERRLETL